MKDLFILTADADAEAVLRAVLIRHNSLGIRPVSFDIRRYPGRDSGMVRQGPETARLQASKSEYSRLLLIWDHHGSGWESRTASDAVARIQARLDGITWLDRSSAVVIVPELEEWLWHCPASIAKHLGVDNAELSGLTEQAAARLSAPLEKCKRELPKELFERVLYSRFRRKPLPDDFSRLGFLAELSRWRASESFAQVAGVLQNWFAQV